MILYNAMKIGRMCLICCSPFFPEVSEINAGRGITCSRVCGDKSAGIKRTGAAHAFWKGEKVGYGALHVWLLRQLGKAKVCVTCGSVKRVQWANKSRKYKRTLNDWLALCELCHRRYDGITKFSKEEAAIIRERILRGEIQRKLAKEYGVSQSTMSAILRNKIQYYAR